MRALVFLCLFTVHARPVSPEVELKRRCTRCHQLGVIRAQHLSRAEWNRELDKMTAMGAKVSNRAALLDYLAKKYSDRAK
jgi:hypothetical protein